MDFAAITDPEVSSYIMRIDKMQDCPVSFTIAMIQGKWVPRILWHLRSGPSTFGNICRATGAAEAVLARTLRAMTQSGLIEKTPKLQGGVKMVEYSYSQLGTSLIPVLDALGDWGVDTMKK